MIYPLSYFLLLVVHYRFVVLYKDVQIFERNEIPKVTIYFCGHDNCKHEPFRTKSGRDHHEKAVHNYDRYDAYIFVSL